MEKEELETWIAKIAKKGVAPIDNDDISYLYGEKKVEATEMNYTRDKGQLQEIKILLKTKFAQCQRFILNITGDTVTVKDVNDLCNCFSPMTERKEVLWGYEVDPSKKNTTVLIVGSY
ncbi:MAG: hypothetical protein MJZ28_00770 [Paludibacteraceae bacterium]|nr:hypothetical protein [Paludibacteraceae bacterium]